MAEPGNWRAARLLLHKVLPSGGSTEIPFSDAGMVVFKGGLSITFSNADRKVIDDAATQIRRERVIARSFLQSEIFSDLKETVIATCSKAESYRKRFLKNALDQLREEMEGKLKTWLVEVPFSNIALGAKRSVKIGKCTLRTRTSYRIRQHRMKLQKISAEREAAGFNIHPNIERQMRDTLGAREGEVVGLVKVRSTVGWAKAHALDHCRRAIAVLKLYTLPVDDDHGSFMGVQGEAPVAEPRTVLAFDGDREIHFGHERTLVGRPWTFDEDRWEWMEANHFEEVGTLVSKNHGSDLPKRLRSAIEHIGHAWNIPAVIGRTQEFRRHNLGEQTKSDNHLLAQRLIGFLAGLEALLLADNQRSKGKMMARRVAAYIAKEGYELTVYADVKNAYEDRNLIVHQGSAALTKGLVDRIGLIAQHVVFATVSQVNKYRRKAEWIAFLESLDESAKAWHRNQGGTTSSSAP